MNERPTPETDAARHDLSDYGSPVPCSYGDWVPFELAEKLERERDEAREKWKEQNEALRTLAEHGENEIQKLIKERDEAWACCDELVVDSNAITLAKTVMRLERERDEAREALAEWHDSALHVRQEYEDEQHCSCVPILRKLLKDAERERDEAIADRDIARLSALDSDRAHDRMVAELEKVYKERDEAYGLIKETEEYADRFCKERDEAREALEFRRAKAFFQKIGKWEEAVK